MPEIVLNGILEDLLKYVEENYILLPNQPDVYFHKSEGFQPSSINSFITRKEVVEQWCLDRGKPGNDLFVQFRP